jgi:hypothetical protein
MSNKNITFDPNSGVPYAANLTIYTGADFKGRFNVTTTSRSPFDFTNWTGSSQMAKSVSIGATLGAVATFNVGFTSAAGGKFEISLGSTETRNLDEGRYVYNVLVSSGSTTYNIINGNILVYAGISSAP